jgi:hypothetical protein
VTAAGAFSHGRERITLMEAVMTKHHRFEAFCARELPEMDLTIEEIVEFVDLDDDFTDLPVTPAPRPVELFRHAIIEDEIPF